MLLLLSVMVSIIYMVHSSHLSKTFMHGDWWKERVMRKKITVINKLVSGKINVNEFDIDWKKLEETIIFVEE